MTELIEMAINLIGIGITVTIGLAIISLLAPFFPIFLGMVGMMTILGYMRK